MAVPWGRVTRAEHQRVGIRIIGPAQPCGTATGFPHVARPCRVQLSGHGAFCAVQRADVTFDYRTGPDDVASIGVACLYFAHDPEFTARVAGDDQAVHDQRGGCIGIACLVISNLFVPHHVAGLLVQRHDAGIKCSEINVVAIDCGTAVYHVTARQNAFGQTGIILPQLFAGHDINRIHPAIGPGDIHHAIMHDGLGFLTALLFPTKAKGPRGLQVFDVFLVQQFQRRMALQMTAHAVCQNVASRCAIVGQHVFGHTGGICPRQSDSRHDADGGGNDKPVHSVNLLPSALLRAYPKRPRTSNGRTGPWR